MIEEDAARWQSEPVRELGLHAGDLIVNALPFDLTGISCGQRPELELVDRLGLVECHEGAVLLVLHHLVEVEVIRFGVAVREVWQVGQRD